MLSRMNPPPPTVVAQTVSPSPLINAVPSQCKIWYLATDVYPAGPMAPSQAFTTSGQDSPLYEGVPL